MNEHERVRGLIRSLGSTVRNRQAALQELSKYGDNSLAIEAIVAALGDGNSGVQRMADSMIMSRAHSAAALGRIGHAASLGPLRLALLSVLGQMVRDPGVLAGYQEERHLRERREAERLAREGRRGYYRELGKS